MSHKNKPIRAQAAREAQEDAEDEAEIAQSLHKWKRAAIWLGLTLLASSASGISFSHDHSLHRYSDTFGKYLLLLSGLLWAAVIYTAANAFIMWRYLRSVRKINKEFANANDTHK